MSWVSAPVAQGLLKDAWFGTMAEVPNPVNLRESCGCLTFEQQTTMLGWESVPQIYGKNTEQMQSPLKSSVESKNDFCVLQKFLALRSGLSPSSPVYLVPSCMTHKGQNRNSEDIGNDSHWTQHPTHMCFFCGCFHVKGKIEKVWTR